MKDRFTTNPAGETVYVAIDGDVIDDIACVHYGRHAKFTEAILAANPGLADLGVTLPAGTVVKLPRVQAEPTPIPVRRLWD